MTAFYPRFRDGGSVATLGDMLLPHTSEWVSHPHGDRVSQELSPFPSVPLSLVGKFRMNESHMFAEAVWRPDEILTVAVTVDDVVGRAAVGL